MGAPSSATSGERGIWLRVGFENGFRIGPGKIALLEAIGTHRSISAAARALGMSYRRAWLLVEEVNSAFTEPALRTYPGRARGGGTELTAFGEQLIALYRETERRTAAVAADQCALLNQKLNAKFDRPIAAPEPA